VLARENDVDLENPFHFHAFLEAVLAQLPPALRALATGMLAGQASGQKKWWQLWRR